MVYYVVELSSCLHRMKLAELFFVAS